jgi:hypothetical protein
VVVILFPEKKVRVDLIHYSERKEAEKLSERRAIRCD